MPTPRGMRDFTPELALLRKDVFSRIERVFRSFGFDPIETPIVELWETLKGKYGSEEKLVYWFRDPWGGKELALRYDLTVPLARFLAEHPELPLPFKRYAIGRVYRHDEPQRGRYREFYQCDVDIVGARGPEADAEILRVIGAVMREFRLPGYTIKLNDRRLLRGIFRRELGIENPLEVYRAIDKLDKIGWEGVEKELRQLLPASKVRRVRDILEMSGSPDEVLDQLEMRFKDGGIREAVEYLREVVGLAGKNHIKLDLSLVRGLDYYTGPIFETVVKSPRIGSITGGGRYDELLGKYGKDLPAVGTTIGVERLIDAGLALGIFRTRKTVAEVYVASIGAREYAWEIAERLRDAGVPTRVDLMGRNWRRQLQEAEKLGIPRVVLVGRKEEEKKQAVLIEDGERRQLGLDELIRSIAK